MAKSRNPKSKSIREQLRAAFEASDLTLEELIKRSGLKCDFHSMSRKLHGKQTLRTEEAEMIASALRTPIYFEPRRIAA